MCVITIDEFFHDDFVAYLDWSLPYTISISRTSKTIFLCVTSFTSVAFKFCFKNLEDLTSCVYSLSKFLSKSEVFYED